MSNGYIYKNPDNGEPIIVLTNIEPFSIRIVCCDCGLAHDVKVESDKKRKLMFILVLFAFGVSPVLSSTKSLWQGGGLND